MNFKVFTATEESESATPGMVSMIDSRTRQWLYPNRDSPSGLQGPHHTDGPQPQLSK